MKKTSPNRPGQGDHPQGEGRPGQEDYEAPQASHKAAMQIKRQKTAASTRGKRDRRARSRSADRAEVSPGEREAVALQKGTPARWRPTRSVSRKLAVEKKGNEYKLRQTELNEHAPRAVPDARDRDGTTPTDSATGGPSRPCCGATVLFDDITTVGAPTTRDRCVADARRRSQQRAVEITIGSDDGWSRGTSC